MRVHAAGSSDMRLGFRLSGVLMLIASAFLSFEGRAEDLAPMRPTPLLGAVLETPRPVPGSDGREHIVYEIRIINVTDGRAAIESIEVLDVASGQAVARLDKAAVSARLTLGGHRGAESNDIGAYQVAVLFMHVALAEGARIPDRITHQVHAALGA